MAATTREIAEEAGVNEVTLFRLFESKDQLLSAVVGEVVRAESEALDRVDLDHFDLRRDIPELARGFYATHERYQAFLRTHARSSISSEADGTNHAGSHPAAARQVHRLPRGGPAARRCPAKTSS